MSTAPRLIVNLSMLGEKPTGLGVYAQHCADVLFAQPGALAIQTPWHRSQHPYPEFQRCPDAVAIGAGKLASLKRLLWLARLPLRDSDLVYSPTHHGLPWHRNQVITVHDLICLKHPGQNRKQYLFFRFVLPLIARRCRAVFTVSHAMRQQLIDRWGLQPEAVYVVPNVAPAAKPPAPEGAQGDQPARPYLLAVGAGYPHKNLHETLAMHQHWADQHDLHVVSCTGAYRQAIEAQVQALGLQDRVTLHDYISRDALDRLYRGCAALVYPSTDEGFGIPPLEALAYGKPVIASSIAVHQEVLGESAIFVELGQAASWARAFAQLHSPQLLGERMAKAPATLAKYRKDTLRDSLQRALTTLEPGLESVCPPSTGNPRSPD